MIDPAVAYAPGQGYAAYDRGKALDVWLKAANGSDSLGLVWPGKHWQVVDNPNSLFLIVGIIVHRCHRLPRLVHSEYRYLVTEPLD